MVAGPNRAGARSDVARVALVQVRPCRFGGARRPRARRDPSGSPPRCDDARCDRHPRRP
jgi:hypothetical protein